MGKATIVSGGTDGNYTIKMDYGKEVRDGRVTKVNAALAEIGPKITEALGNLNTQEIIEGGAVADVEAAINAYVAATQAVPVAHQAIDAARANVDSAQATLGNVPAGVAFDIIRGDAAASLATAKAAVTAAEAALKSAEAAIKPAIERHAKLASALMNEKARTAQKQIVLDLLNEQKKAMETEESDLSGVEPEETMQAWCADFTENGTGEVGTIEVPGENTHVLIVPGAKAHSSADGNLAARELMSPEQVFFNAAILPGWQKFKPTFRRGTITALDYDANTAGVAFDDDKSSAQELGVNRYPSLQGIPVIYMTCHAGAFAVGDKCLVRFDGQDWSTPKVIGFASNPKPCMPKLIYVPVEMTTVLTSNGARPWIKTYVPGSLPGNYFVYQYTDSAPMVMATITAKTGTPHIGIVAFTGHTINCGATTLKSWASELFTQSYAPNLMVPSGAVATRYDISTPNNGHITISTYNSQPVVILTLPLWSEYNDELFTGGAYLIAALPPAPTFLSMPLHEYFASTAPSVSLTYKGNTYLYTLKSSAGKSLIYEYEGPAP